MKKNLLLCILSVLFLCSCGSDSSDNSDPYDFSYDYGDDDYPYFEYEVEKPDHTCSNKRVRDWREIISKCNHFMALNRGQLCIEKIERYLLHNPVFYCHLNVVGSDGVIIVSDDVLRNDIKEIRRTFCPYSLERELRSKVDACNVKGFFGASCLNSLKKTLKEVEKDGCRLKDYNLYFELEKMDNQFRQWKEA